MNYSKIWVTVFFYCFFVISSLLVVTLFTANFYGDLTRIGRLSEYYFGWRASKPSIDSTQLKSSKFTDANIIVIGDSFSIGLIWQSALIRNGFSVKTLSWNEVGFICPDFESWLRKNGFKGNTVIIESIEWATDGNLTESLACKKTNVAIKDIEKLSPPPGSSPPQFSLSWNEKITTGLFVLANTLLAMKIESDLIFHDTGPHYVAVKSVTNGCLYFSNRSCNKSLFMNRDFEHPRLGKDTIVSIKKINEGIKNLNLIWVVIPDKSSVYFETDDYFWRELEKYKLGPNLLRNFKKDKSIVLDLYAPNNTHLSTAGYLLLGNVISNEVKKSQ